MSGRLRAVQAYRNATIARDTLLSLRESRDKRVFRVGLGRGKSRGYLATGKPTPNGCVKRPTKRAGQLGRRRRSVRKVRRQTRIQRFPRTVSWALPPLDGRLFGRASSAVRSATAPLCIRRTVLCCRASTGDWCSPSLRRLSARRSSMDTTPAWSTLRKP